MENVAIMDIVDISLHQQFSFIHPCLAADIDSFAELSGDRSPIHIDDAFAGTKGFKGRVVHGAFLLALVSRLIGVHLPGQNALVLSMSSKFHVPIYVGDTVQIKGEVDQISSATKTISVNFTIISLSTNKPACKGKVLVGFTS